MATPSPGLGGLRENAGRPQTDPVPTLEKFIVAKQPVTIWLAGKPIPQGRPKFVRATGHAFDPRRSRVWKLAAQAAIRDQMKEHLLMPLEGPLNIYYEAIFEPPKSYSNKKKVAALDGTLPYTKPPDLDNLLKIFLDAMNGIVFLDDKQVRKIHAEKKYGPEDGVRVTIIERPLMGDQS